METACTSPQLMKLLDQLHGWKVNPEQFQAVLASGYLAAIFNSGADLTKLAELRYLLGIGPVKSEEFEFTGPPGLEGEYILSKILQLNFADIRDEGREMIRVRYPDTPREVQRLRGSFLKYLHHFRLRDLKRDSKLLKVRPGTLGEFLAFLDQCPGVMELAENLGNDSIEIVGTIIPWKGKNYHPYASSSKGGLKHLHFDPDRREEWGDEHLVFVVREL